MQEARNYKESHTILNSEKENKREREVNDKENE